MDTSSEARALIARERDLIAGFDFDRTTWRFQRNPGGGTTSHASFRYALSMPDAPAALAMLRAYISAVSLDRSEGWGVSAMPNWQHDVQGRRFATVSGGGIELFFAWFEPTSGRVTGWGTRFSPNHTPQSSDPDEVWRSAAANGDITLNGETLDGLLDVLDDQDVLDSLTATRDERATSRKSDWHNPYLGAFLGARDAPDGTKSEPSSEEAVEFERRYTERVTRSRLHQAKLREAALRHYTPAACYHCGLDVVDVLEAAHLEPDSAGGAASVSNIRLLCANHHRAFDRGLLTWEPHTQSFAPDPGAKEVPPSPLR